MKVMLDPGAYMPTRAHEDDAGLDLYAMHSATVYAHSAEFFDTGVHIEIPKGFVGFVKSRSGLMMKFSLQTDGTIDSGYTGSIGVMLFNHGDHAYLVGKGERIAQLVLLPIAVPTELELVDSLEETERGNGGFGSTGGFGEVLLCGG